MSTIIKSSIPYATQTSQAAYSQLFLHYDEKYKLEWCYMRGAPRPSFNPILLKEMGMVYESLHKRSRFNQTLPIDYQVLASDVPGIFNLGGDLELFKRLIKTKDRKNLSAYAHSCVSTVYAKATLHQCGVTHIALVQGDALGGGFEAALSADILIAERSAKMGFPEILFNLFPGMGAHSLLSRKIELHKAEKLILSGKLYSAEELHDMGIVDILAEDGAGETAVYNYIQYENRSRNGIQAMRKVKDIAQPLSYKQLIDITDTWVEAAMQLRDRDLRMMERLVSRQNHKLDPIAA
ncbi:MAG TPA: crotonase/enoyl-CoA hydratase family protein [Gammaproteobacteria bacterium]